MPKRFSRAKPIIGVIGACVAAVIVCTFGQTRRRSNCRTARMAGSVSYWTVNWQRCIPVEAQKMAMTAQVFAQCI